MLKIITSEIVIEYDIKIKLQIKFSKKKNSVKRLLNVLLFNSLKSLSLKARITRINKLFNYTRVRVNDLAAVNNFNHKLFYR